MKSLEQDSKEARTPRSDLGKRRLKRKMKLDADDKDASGDENQPENMAVQQPRSRHQPDIEANLLDEILTWKKLELMQSPSIQSWLSQTQANIAMSKPQDLIQSLEEAIAREKAGTPRQQSTQTIAERNQASAKKSTNINVQDNRNVRGVGVEGDAGLQMTDVDADVDEEVRETVRKHPFLPRFDLPQKKAEVSTISTYPSQLKMSGIVHSVPQPSVSDSVPQSMGDNAPTQSVQDKTRDSVAFSVFSRAPSDTDSASGARVVRSEVARALRFGDSQKFKPVRSSQPELTRLISQDVDSARTPLSTGDPNKPVITQVKKYPLLLSQLTAGEPSASAKPLRDRFTLLSNLLNQLSDSTSGDGEGSSKSKLALSIQAHLRQVEMESSSLSALDLATILSRENLNIDPSWQPMLDMIDSAPSSPTLMQEQLEQTSSMMDGFPQNVQMANTSEQMVQSSSEFQQDNVVSAASLQQAMSNITQDRLVLQDSTDIAMECNPELNFSPRALSRTAFRAQSAPTIQGNLMQRNQLQSPVEFLQVNQMPQAGALDIASGIPSSCVSNLILPTAGQVISTESGDIMQWHVTESDALLQSPVTKFDNFAVPAPPTATRGIYTSGLQMEQNIGVTSPVSPNVQRCLQTSPVPLISQPSSPVQARQAKQAAIKPHPIPRPQGKPTISTLLAGKPLSPIAPKPLAASPNILGLTFSSQNSPQAFHQNFRPIYPKTLQGNKGFGKFLQHDGQLMPVHQSVELPMALPGNIITVQQPQQQEPGTIVSIATHSGLPQMPPPVQRVSTTTSTSPSTAAAAQKTSQSEAINWQWHVVEPQRPRPRSVNRGANTGQRMLTDTSPRTDSPMTSTSPQVQTLTSNSEQSGFNTNTGFAWETKDRNRTGKDQ